MYIREWKCVCPPETEADFITYLGKTGVKDTRELPGCTGYCILRRETDTGVEITLQTFWASLDAMKAYAGDQLYRARLYPEDDTFRITPEQEVKIYKIVDSQQTP